MVESNAARYTVPPPFRRTVAVRLLALACAVAFGAAAPAAASTPSRVRSADARMLELLEEGVARSATFRQVVSAITESDGIVYVEFGTCAFGHLNGCLLPYLGAARDDRYLRVLVIRDKNRTSHHQLLALIAHELQHAREVIEHREVVDVLTMDAMFGRIGRPIAGVRGYETSAAHAVTDAVLSELDATRRTR